ncbi:MAG: collagen-like protein [Pseudomonadota bacterium]
MRLVSFIALALFLPTFASATQLIPMCRIDSYFEVTQDTEIVCISGNLFIDAQIMTMGNSLKISAVDGDVIFTDRSEIRAYPEDIYQIESLEMQSGANGKPGVSGEEDTHRRELRNGDNGDHGQTGPKGADGLSSNLVLVEAKGAIKGHVVIINDGTNGLNGGPGGKGGAGGDGTRGNVRGRGNGITCERHPSPGGDGGDSGRPGWGGPGGNGGDAGLVTLVGSLEVDSLYVSVIAGVAGPSGPIGIPGAKGEGARGKKGPAECGGRADDGDDGRVLRDPHPNLEPDAPKDGSATGVLLGGDKQSLVSAGNA